MSIVACVKVYDGIALGAESVSQLFSQSQFVKAYSNARKLFPIGDLPFAVLTYGAGNIGPRSIESFLYEFNELLNDGEKSEEPTELTAETIATKLMDFIRGHYESAFVEIPVPQRPVLGFFLAGYSPRQHFASEWEFQLPADSMPRQPRPDNQFGASWRGVGAPFSRLFFGVDQRLYGALTEAGMDSEQIKLVQDQSKMLQSTIAFDGMPLQDAIGFCRFILTTTIQATTYEVGVPTCGGPLHIAVITRGESFRWISEPKLE